MYTALYHVLGVPSVSKNISWPDAKQSSRICFCRKGS
jgi:hypothetical protein